MSSTIRDTRSRLLMAAATEFALHGYTAATVRAICSNAEANVAAVKYHFGCKERLYAAVLLNFFESRSAKFPFQEGLASTASPEQRLELFIGNFLLCLCCDDAQDRAHAKLVLEEIANPTPLFAELVTAVMHPIRQAVQEAVSPLLGAHATDEAIRACSVGVVGQALFYLQNRSIIEGMYGDVAFDDEGLKRITRNITRFSLGGIARWKEDHQEKAKQD